MQTNLSMSDSLERYLDLASDQLKLTATNMANIDTPGFKTQGFDFEKEFLREKAGLDAAGPQVGPVDGLVARPDGNNVSMDREGIQLAQAQLKFRMAAEMVKGHFSKIMSAIHADIK
jgi:flagellar basal-body rod protein FlgB